VIFFPRALSTISSSSSPFPSTTIPSILSIPISEKLTKTNYPLWRAQVLPAVRAAQLEGMITGTEKEPEQFISITNADKTVSKETNPACSGSSCARLCPIIAYPGNADACFPLHYYAHAWSTLVDLYSSQTRAHSVNTRIALATTKKNQWSVLDYYAKMCQLTDDLAASGAPL
jgi:hypothetical protein